MKNDFHPPSIYMLPIILVILVILIYTFTPSSFISSELTITPSPTDIFYYNEALSMDLQNMLKAANFKMDHIKVRTSSDSAQIDIEWHGDSSLGQTFATTCLQLRDLILLDSVILSDYALNSLTFTYTQKENSTHFTFSPTPEDLYLFDEDTILNKLSLF